MKIRCGLQSLKGKGFSLTLHPLSLILLAAVVLLPACGFQLRGQAPLPFESLYVSGTSQFANQVARAVVAGTQTRITDNAGDAQVTLQIISEQRERAILSLSSGGRVRELQLRYHVVYRLYDQNKKEHIPRTEIVVKRDLTYNDTEVIAKEQEVGLLYRDMQNDAAQQLVRRLQSMRIDS